MGIVWPLCCALMYFGGVDLVYIHEGLYKNAPKVGPGTDGKGHKTWGWPSTKFENHSKVFHDYIIY